jgi:hypothetical protein
MISAETGMTRVWAGVIANFASSPLSAVQASLLKGAFCRSLPIVIQAVQHCIMLTVAFDLLPIQTVAAGAHRPLATQVESN